MVMLPGTILTVQDQITARSGVRLCRIRDWVECTWQETSGSGGAKNRGYARLVLPATSPALSSLSFLSVLRIDHPRRTGGFRTWEYRVTELDDDVIRADDGNTAVAVATLAPIIEDFGRFQIRSLVGGVPSKLVAFTGTPESFITELLIPAIEDPDLGNWPAGVVVTGDVSPTMQLTFSGRDQSPLSIGTWLEQQTSSDLWLERISDTLWKMHLTTRGSDAPPPLAFVGRNVQALHRTIIMDDRFATRVEPEGRTATDEQDPSGIGGAAWEAASRDGGNDRLITIADPSGGTGPTVADGDLDGKQALYALDPLHGSNTTTARKPRATLTSIVTTATRGTPLTLAFDPTRRILWGHTENGESDEIWWRSVENDEVSGTVVLGIGASRILRLCYDPTNDCIVACPDDVAAIVIVDAGTKTVAHTVTTSAVPLGMSLVETLGLAFAQYGTTSDVIEVIDTASGTVVGTLAATDTMAGASTRVVYNAGASRLFAIDASSGVYKYFDSTTYAAAGSGTGATGYPCEDDSASEILVMNITTSDATKHSIDPSTGARTSTTLPDFPYTPAAPGNKAGFFSACGRHYLLTTKYLIGFDASTDAWVTPPGDVGRAEIGDALGTSGGWCIERGASSSENAIAYTASFAGVRRHVLTPSGNPASPFESWEIQASTASPQTITAPAANAGGPVKVPVETDGPGQSALIEVRQNAALEYRTRLEDASALDTWGPIDSSPQYDVLAKRNYWRGSTFDASTFKADNTSRYLAVTRIEESRFGDMENRWRAADQTGFAFKPLTLTADVDTTSDFPDLVMSVTGLNAGTVLSPGDIITTRDTFAKTAFGATTIFFFVRKRTVADASGNATIPVTPNDDFTFTPNTGDTVYLSSPPLTLAPGRENCVVLYPTLHNANSVTALVGVRSWPTWRAEIPVPQILGDSVCWVVAHVSMVCARFIPADFKMTVRAPFGDADMTAVSPEDTVALQSGELRDYWLAQRIDLLNPNHGFVGVSLTCGPTTTQTDGLEAVIYLQSLQVVLAAASTNPVDLFGAEGPNTLYQLATARLAAGNSPTINYQLKALEDGEEFAVGAKIEMRDPARRIHVSPSDLNPLRVVAVTREATPPGRMLELPEIEVGNTPLASFTGQLVSTQTTAQRPPATSGSVIPVTPGGGGTPIGGGTPPSGGGVAGVPVIALSVVFAGHVPIVTATPMTIGITAVRFAATAPNAANYPDADTVRAATPDSSAPYEATFAALTGGDALKVSAIAVDGAGNESAKTDLAINFVSPFGAHTHWRFRSMLINAGFYDGNTSVKFSAMRFRDDAGNEIIATGGTPLESSHSGSNDASLLFDGVDSTFWSSNGGGDTAWCGYQFASPVPVMQVALQVNSSILTPNIPLNGRIEYSDDGVVWKDAAWIEVVGGFTNDVPKWFNLNSAVRGALTTFGTHAYWRFMSPRAASSLSDQMSALLFKDASGSAIATTGGTAIGQVNTLHPTSLLFDGTDSTYWAGHVFSNTAFAFAWAGYQFATPQTVMQMAVQRTSSMTAVMPTVLIFQFSDDGETWGTVAWVAVDNGMANDTPTWYDFAGALP